MPLIALTLSSIAMMIVNFLSVRLPLNHISTKQISDILSTMITPAGFTFSIWSVIYIGLIATILALRSKKVVLSDRTLRAYTLSSLANGGRIIAWHYGNLHIAMIIILILLGSLIYADRDMLSYHDRIAYYAWVRGSLLVYIGWVSIASLLMLTIYLQYQLGWLHGIEVPAGIATLIIAGLLNLLIIWREKTIFTSLVALWALWGIMHGQTDPQIIFTAQIVMGVLIGAIGWYQLKDHLS